MIVGSSFRAEEGEEESVRHGAGQKNVSDEVKGDAYATFANNLVGSADVVVRVGGGESFEGDERIT